jgi:hypothetical protein
MCMIWFPSTYPWPVLLHISGTIGSPSCSTPREAGIFGLDALRVAAPLGRLRDFPHYDAAAAAAAKAAAAVAVAASDQRRGPASEFEKAMGKKRVQGAPAGSLRAL